MNFRCVSQESERMFPFLDLKAGAGGADGGGSGGGGGDNAPYGPPGNKVSKVPTVAVSIRLPHLQLAALLRQLACRLQHFYFFCMKRSRCPSVIHNIYRQSHGPERGCSCGQSFPNHLAQLQNCIFEPRR